MSKIEKILSIILISLFLISINSCVTKKKFKESQDLQSTYILDQTEKKWKNSVKNIKSELSESILSQFNETIKSFKESSSTNENESTSISGTLPASDKETSVTVGNTVIKNNGGNVSFDIKSSKQLTSQLETINKELSQSLNEERNARISLETQFSEYVKEQNQINESLKSKLDTKSKETTKKGLPLWAWMAGVVFALLFFAIKYFKVKIPF